MDKESYILNKVIIKRPVIDNSLTDHWELVLNTKKYFWFFSFSKNGLAWVRR